MKFFDKVRVRRRHLIVNEGDLIQVLKVLDSSFTSRVLDWNVFRYRPNIDIGNCGWADERKWFIWFNASNYDWENMYYALHVSRVLKFKDIPKNAIGVYTTD